MKINKVNFLYGFSILTLLFFKVFVFLKFTLKYVDSDQSILWLGAKNYSNGEFHEPLFYGQNYNSLFESLLAVPLLKIGIPVQIALPIITLLLALAPFFILSYVTFRKSSKLTGIVIIAFLFCLPIEYDFIVGLPRGFVTGIAVTSVTFLPFFWTQKKKSFVLFFLINSIAFILNPNSLIVSLTLSFYLFLENIKNLNFYIFSFFGFIIGLCIKYYISSFYINHPNYILHSFSMEPSFSLFKESWSHLDDFFNSVVFVLWKQGWFVLVIPILLSIVLFRKKKKNLALVSCVLPAVFILPLLLNKVHDGTDSVFFSLSRMYLGIPLILLFLISKIDFKLNKIVYAFFLLSFSLVSYKMISINKSITFNLNKNHVVTVKKSNEISNACEGLGKLTRRFKIDLIVICNHEYYDHYNYACPCLINDLAKTVRPSYERRTWRLIEDNSKVYRTILFIDNKNDLSLNHPEMKKLTSDFYLLKYNNLKTKDVYQKYGIEVRKF